MKIMYNTVDYKNTAVTEKPSQAREMKSTVFPKNVLDVTGESPREGELYHEGYVDGNLYLVPDRNLKAMKDMINFKMIPRKSIRYKGETSYELPHYEHFKGKIYYLLDKVDNMSELTVSEDEKPIEPAEMEKEPSVESVEEIEEEETEEEIEDETEPEPEEEIEEETEPEPEEEIEEETEEEIIPIVRPEPDEFRLRFLLSGHFKTGQKPIYIIQEYDGEPDIFKDQKADFTSTKNEGNVDIFVSGKFYNENILEESQGKPIALNITPEKILIDKGRSKIYEKYFEEIFEMKTVDISLKGAFITSKILNTVTPFVSLGVKQKSPAKYNFADQEESMYNRNATTTVLLYKPIDKNPFFSRVIDDEGNKTDSDSSNSDILYSSSSGISSDEPESSIMTGSSRDSNISNNHSQSSSTFDPFSTDTIKKPLMQEKVGELNTSVVYENENTYGDDYIDEMKTNPQCKEILIKSDDNASNQFSSDTTMKPLTQEKVGELYTPVLYENKNSYGDDYINEMKTTPQWKGILKKSDDNALNQLSSETTKKPLKQVRVDELNPSVIYKNENSVSEDYIEERKTTPQRKGLFNKFKDNALYKSLFAKRSVSRDSKKNQHQEYKKTANTKSQQEQKLVQNMFQPQSKPSKEKQARKKSKSPIHSIKKMKIKTY